MTLAASLAVASPLGPPAATAEVPIQVSLGISGDRLPNEGRTLRLPRRVLRGDWTIVDGIGVWLEGAWVHGHTPSSDALRGWSAGAGFRATLRPKGPVGGGVVLQGRAGREWVLDTTRSEVEGWADRSRIRAAAVAIIGPPTVRAWAGPSSSVRLDRDLLGTDPTSSRLVGPHLLVGGQLSSSDIVGPGSPSDLRVWTALELELVGIVAASLLAGVSF